MRRASLERARTVRTWRAHQSLIHPDRRAACRCDEQAGRFRKGRRVAGCHVARCGICKRHKRIDEPSHRDYRAAVDPREWSRELGFVFRMPRKPW